MFKLVCVPLGESVLNIFTKDVVENKIEKVLTKFYERFMPDKDEQDAERAFLQLIHESVNAFFPKLMETFHIWATYWK